MLLGCGVPTSGGEETGSGEVEGSSGEAPTSGAGETSSEGSEGSSGGETGEEDACGAGWADDLALGPGPVMLPEGLAVPIDVTDLRGWFTVDVAGEATTVAAQLTFRVGALAGRPVFDLRQEPDAGDLDGEAIGALWSRDLGGGAGSEMRVLDREVAACSEHVLTLAYTLVRPPGFAADPPRFKEDGVAWDLSFNDVAPRMFLEQWLPANLVHDRHPISLSLTIVGGAADQRAISNGEVTTPEAGRWDIGFPADSTAQSPMLVLAPASEVVSQSVMVDEVELVVHRTEAFSEEPGALLDLLADAYAEYVASTGAYRYPRFVAVISPNAGMEYDGGTTSDVVALPHELFHSWFGRGVRPRRGADGWIDEAWNEYNTGEPQFPATPMGMESPAVTLCDDDNPWSRSTPLAAYDTGKAVFAGIAAEAGVDQLRAAMRAFYAEHAGAPVTTGMLEQHLHCALAVDAVRALFHRYVYGRQGEPAAAQACP